MASLPPGTLLSHGRYQILREINRGGTAVVYEAIDTRSAQTVALKVLNVKDGRLMVPVKAVQREIELAAGLRACPYVVQLLDFFAEGEHQGVIVWELVEGPDMLDLLNEHGGRMAEEAVAHYFAQLVRGVQYLHDRGLCHRDIKPENVLVERSTGRIRIIDFGLSKRQASAVTLGVGTCDYAAPEIIAGGNVSVFHKRTVGCYDAAKVDCWAMGVLLYLLVVGRYPFEDPARPQDVVCTLRNISAGLFRPIPLHVSPACADLIHRMLVLDPADRLSLAEMLAHPWLAAAAAATSPAAGADSKVGAVAEAAAVEEEVGCGMDLDEVASQQATRSVSSQDQVEAAAVACVLQQLNKAAGMEAEVEEWAEAAAGAEAEAGAAGSTIAAFPAAERAPTFSFPHPSASSSGEGEGKAPPATPRVVNMTASSAGAASSAGTAGEEGSKAAAAAAAATLAAPLGVAPAQQGPPSRGQGEPDCAAGQAKRQRASPGSYLCSFFGGALLFGGGSSCPRTASCNE